MSTVSGSIIATISRKNDQINAQLSRLSSIPFLGKRYNSPKTLGGQQALLADAMGWVNALNTLILPSLYGTLGALAFILRNHSASWKAATVSGDFTGEYSIRMVLGLVAWVAIGLFLRPPEGTLEGFAIMTPVALSFIAGYAVELLFGIMRDCDCVFYLFTELKVGWQPPRRATGRDADDHLTPVRSEKRSRFPAPAVF